MSADIESLARSCLPMAALSEFVGVDSEKEEVSRQPPVTPERVDALVAKIEAAEKSLTPIKVSFI